MFSLSSFRFSEFVRNFVEKENYRNSWNNSPTQVANQVRDNSDPVNFYFLICSHQIIAKKKMLSNCWRAISIVSILRSFSLSVGDGY